VASRERGNSGREPPPTAVRAPSRRPPAAGTGLLGDDVFGAASLPAAAAPRRRNAPSVRGRSAVPRPRWRLGSRRNTALATSRSKQALPGRDCL